MPVVSNLSQPRPYTDHSSSSTPVEQRSMHVWEDVFQHFAEYRVIVCKRCQYAVRPDHVQAHLQQAHRTTSKDQRESIARVLAEWRDVARKKDDVRYPHPHDAPISGLPIYSDGLKCNGSDETGETCRYICRTIRGIQQHCKQQHGWVNRQKRGDRITERKKHSPNRMWTDEQHCQRLFENPQWKKYFAVKLQPAQFEQSEVDFEARERRADAIIKKHEADLKAHKRERLIGGEGGRYVPMPWLDFTGWHRHLGEFKMDVVQYVQPAVGEVVDEQEMRTETGDEGSGSDGAEEEDDGLVDACRATRALIRTALRKCQDADGEHGVGKAALEHINRREVGSKDKEKRFYARHTAQSIDKYSARWSQVLRYIWRTAEKEERPKYRLTERQRRSLDSFKTLARRDGEDELEGEQVARRSSARGEQEWRERMQTAALTFWIAMFDHELRDSEYESGIISGLAVVALNTRAGGWMPPIVYTSVCAAMMTVLRAFVVYRAWRTRTESIRMHIDSGMSEDEARERAPSVLEGVTEMADRFMTVKEFRGKPTPMDRIHRQKAYGIAIRDGENVAPRTAWSGDELRIDGIAFTMDDIRSVVHGVLESARVRLRVDLMFVNEMAGSEQLPRLNVDELFDNPAEVDEDWNFLQDHRTVFSVEGHKWLWKRMYKDRALELRFTDGASADAQCLEEVGWNEQGVEEYIRKVRRFKEELIVLVHMSAGAPARSTELTSITTTNPMVGRGRRGVYIERGLVVFVPEYGKMSSHSGKVKVIHRYVPREVSELVVYYLWIVDPFVRLLQAGLQGQMDFSRFLWEPKPERQWIDGWEDGEGEVDDADKEEGVEEEEEEEGEVADMEEGEVRGGIGEVTSSQPGEWPEIGGREQTPQQPLNVDGFWNTDRVRRAVQSEWVSRFGVKMTINRWRQCYPAIQRKFTRDAEVAGMLEVLYNDKSGRTKQEAVSRMIGDAVEQQSGHSREREESNYGRGVFDSPFTTESLQAAFRRVSVDWHRFLRFDSAFRHEQADPDVRARIKREEEEERFRRWRWIRRIDIDAQLKRIVGESAEFRGMQRPGLTAIIERELRVLVVMRTGGGKSLMFMLPAAGSQDGVTVVVVPLNALRADLTQRCERAGIPCAEWEGGRRPPYRARIVFVTPEAAVKEAFGRFMNEKVASGQLERVVIDECHVVLEEKEDDPFRPEMLKLYEMTEKQTQVVFLTATLPPHEETSFCRVMGLTRPDLITFRDVTTRPNVRYRVVEYEREEMEGEVQRLVTAKKQQYPLPGQIIVYCRMITQATALAQALECSVFHRRVGDAAEKSRLLHRFTSGGEHVMTATNAFGLGIDAPSIRAVIHVGIRPSMKQYAQESGRAGRDGQASEAIVMRASWTDRNGRRRTEGESGLEGAMQEFIRGQQCRRIPLDREMDGRSDRTGCEGDEQACDVCRRPSTGRRKRRFVTVGEAGEQQVVKRVKRRGGAEVEVEEEEEETEEEEEEGEEGDEEQAVRVAEEKAVREAEEEAEREARIEYERNRQRQTVVEAGERTRRTGGGGHVVDGLVERFEAYRGRCGVCQARGFESIDHFDWRSCRVAGGFKGRTARVWESLGQIDWADYAACRQCWAPQSVCHSWKEIGSEGRLKYRREGEWRCQYRGVLRDAAAAVLAVVGSDEGGSSDQVNVWIKEAARAIGIREDDGEWEQARRWFGAKVKDGSIEMSGLCRFLQVWG
jgi:superfamily II DNA helicase RecQ